MAKLIFVLYRRAELSHEQALAEWSGARHSSLARNIPGLKKWVQNHVTELPNETAPDGIGELWFDDPSALERAMSSPEFAAAANDAGTFLDMQRTCAVIVDEKIMLGAEAAV